MNLQREQKRGTLEETAVIAQGSSICDSAEESAMQQSADEMFASKVSFRVKIIIGLALVVVVFVSFAVGRYAIDPATLVRDIYLWFTNPGLFDIDSPDANLDLVKEGSVLFKIRFPRVIVVMLVGAALAVSGASYQGMFKNPLVSPDLLGASAGASLGACLALLLNMPNIMIQVFAFVGGMVAVGCAVWLNRTIRYDALLGLILGGILVSTLFQSGTSLIKYVADADDKLPAITFWLMGSFADVNNRDLIMIIVPMVCGFGVLIFESWKLNVLSFGDEEARAMGVNTKRVRLIVIFASTLLTSLSVAVAGIIGWVGLVIPHLARAIVGPNYKVLLPTSMVVGAGFLLIVDNIARVAMSVEIPIGILTSILGVPFFIFIYKRNMKGW